MFKNISNISFQQNLFIGNRVVSYGMTERRTEKQKERRKDGHDEANSRFSQFYERA
jgi:hypothetical protein